MDPAVIALLLYLFYLATAFALRRWLHRRRTRSIGFRGLSGRTGSPGWWGGILFVLAILAGFTAPILQLLGSLGPIALLDGTIGHVIRAAVAVTGIGATLVAQQSMGSSWRIGVDLTETTTLVRTGIFGAVRNPIFTAMLVTAGGLALLTPNVVALVAFAALFAAIELQVRAVEEPYLHRMHGDAYRDYTGKVGRFVPRVGRTNAAKAR